MKVKTVKEFKLKPGQVDFTHARFAPVINCLLRYKGKILIVQRNPKLNFYPGVWNGISGFLDDKRSLQEKIQDELKEELGIPKSKIRSIRLGEIFHQEEKKYKKTWIVHPILVEVATDKVRLDWEAKKYAWVSLNDIYKHKLLPGFDLVLEKLSLWIVS